MATSDAPLPPVASDSPEAHERISFIPIEANPELMTSLLHKLGLSPALQIHDVYSITEPDLLAFIPRPALALLLVFPVSAAYTSHKLAEDAGEPMYEGCGPAEPVIWYRQTIRNACGLMGLLHAVSNGPARGFVQENTPLSRLIQQSIPLKPDQRANLLERTPELASAHAEAASQGDTVAPDAKDDVDLHYVCFVKTEDGKDGKSGTLWEMDGSRKGPIRRGTLGADEDVLSEKALLWGPLQFLEREGGDLRFSCVALAGSLD